ncbi:DUF4870 domain-containing protein [Microbacterium esteraromaticum]|nr:DUF4870 domain-containing protein [Microbacterium esteraromaticum]
MTDPNADPVSGAPAGAPSAPAASAPLTAAEDAQWAMLAHFLNIVLVLPALIIFLVFKERGPRVAVESKEALNWTINVAGVVIVLNILSAILGFIPILGFIAWILLTLVIWAVIIVNIIFAIKGGLKVKSGGSYRYPLNYRWIK